MPSKSSNKGPTVPKPGGGRQPRDRNENGRWREKRSDAGHPRKSGGTTDKK